MIYTLEVGKGVKVVKLIAFFLILATVAVFYDLQSYKNFNNPEAMDAAQVARNLARGKGFTTQSIAPLALHLVGEKLGAAARLGHAPQPDLNNPPVYPLVLAGLMKVLPFHYDMDLDFWFYQPEFLIALFNQALFFLTVWLVFRLTRKLFDEPAAWVTAIVLLGSDLLWRFSVSGLPTMLLMLIFTGLLWCLVKLEEGGREAERPAGWFVRWAVLTGLVTGLGALTRYSFGWLMLPALLFLALFMERRRGLVCGLSLLVFLVVVTPWLARNYSVSGTLFGLRGYVLQEGTMAFPAARLERSLTPDESKLEPHDYVFKFLVNLGDLARNDLPKLGGGSWVAAFFLPALFLPLRSQVLRRLRMFVVSSLLLLIVVEALGRTHLSTDSPGLNGENLLVLLTPAIFMFGVGMFYVVLSQRELPVPELGTLLTTIFTVIACGPMLLNFLPPPTIPISYPPYYPPWIQESARLFTPDELLMSDMPWAVAWYGDRSCVWTPMHVGNHLNNPPDTANSFYAVNDEQQTVSGLLLGPLTTNARSLKELLQGKDYDWLRFAADILMNRSLPNRFPLQNCRIRYLTAGMILLADRARWNEKTPSAPTPEELDTAHSQPLRPPMQRPFKSAKPFRR
jgi:hypothetical protein